MQSSVARILGPRGIAPLRPPLRLVWNVRAATGRERAFPAVLTGPLTIVRGSVLSDIAYGLKSQASSLKPSLQQRILDSTDAARARLDKIDAAHTEALVTELKKAEEQVHAAIRELAFNPTANSQALRLARLENLKQQTGRFIDDAVKRQKALIPGHSEESFKSGLSAGVGDFKAQQTGGWGGLSAEQQGMAAQTAFGLVDRTALDFLTAYRLELAGSVGEDLKGRIKTTLSAGLVQGTPLSEVAQQLGHMVTNPDEFRQAEGRVFPSAANRLQLIVSTENNRAHNQGRLEFYKDAGTTHMRWMAARDQRLCEECSALDGQVFAVGEAPNIPVHPDCRCTIVGEPNAEDGDVIKTPSDYGIPAE